MSGFSPFDLLTDIGMATKWSVKDDPSPEVAALIETLCERSRDRADLTRWEDELLDPSLLSFKWGSASTVHWIRDNTLGNEDSDRKLEVLATAREKIRALSALIQAVQAAVDVEKVLGGPAQRGKPYASNQKVATWLTAYASNCLPSGYESWTVKLYRVWHADKQRLQALSGVARDLVKSRKQLRQYLENTDPHGKIP